MDIVFKNDAFDKNMEHSNLPNTKRKFTAKLSEAQQQAVKLFKFDKFEKLILDADVYKKGEGSDYGIPYDAQIHRGGVIFSHQQSAAQTFLKRLRGFGLLADVVGSGKTYEAGLVLAELAAREEINTMLLIVPDQVYETWIAVMEKQFGLGENSLFKLNERFAAGEILERCGDVLKPKRPCIVKANDFAQWTQQQIENVLFDVVVVDEAHRLCSEDEEFSKSIKLLSALMQTKRRMNKTYCLLLSATPHNGDLDAMFRLWYFIRCQGGNPEDFDSGNNHSDKYNEEKAYYHNHICKGASTVMEFIKIVRLTEVYRLYKDEFLDFVKQKLSERYNNAVKKPSNINQEINKQINELTEYIENENREYDGEKTQYAHDFLNINADSDGIKRMTVNGVDNIRRFEEMDREVNVNIARAYHDGVLRTIMIRQTADTVHRTNSHKYIVNYMFYPAKTNKPFDMRLGNSTISVNPGALKQNMYLQFVSGNNGEHKLTIDGGDNAITADGKRYSLNKYLEVYSQNNIFKEQKLFYDLMFQNGILEHLGIGENSFGKSGALKYYRNQQNEIGVSKEMYTQYLPVFSGTESYAQSIYNEKLKLLKELLHCYSNQNVIVFFDYGLSKRDSVSNRVYNDLKSEFGGRLINGVKGRRDEICEEFNNRKNAVLIVQDACYTEGANLQTATVAINFQVTPNPVAMEQSMGRIYRIGQKNNVIVYSFADMCSLEGYVLMYFARIGVMTDTSGNASIIAGCNSENMVTLKCDACSRVKLMDLSQYKKYVQEDSDELYCRFGELCRHESDRGKLMQIMNTEEFQCDVCGAKIERAALADGGEYLCCSINNGSGQGIMCSIGRHGDRRVYCSKSCAMSHCKKLIRMGCPVVIKYEQNKLTSMVELQAICKQCPMKSKCDKKCYIETGPESVSYCWLCKESDCEPSPHIIEFSANPGWEAACPKCTYIAKKGQRSVGSVKIGKLRAVKARTFETYIRSAYEFKQDGGESFCNNLSAEADNVYGIQQILTDDQTSDNR